ncbi:type II secretion system protein GspL [Niveibacterium umoris]|uniref:General secretion pathway protein L n=1 Tax=Niveibacterium umoris TaxID=1193620 RepID=A0A840BFT1_9RHOO|nr:type II secretion system protein GspL [Niveibacterium umoris]MBB4012391.1 general secretion pathway protein L [Niveibacterium umoris]
MTLLRLYITESWPQEPVCEWELVGPDGRTASAGESEPRHWPAAEQTEFVLAGTQTVWLTTRLPRAPKREQDRLIRFALEDQLVQEPDSQHYTITDRDGESARVLVCARDRLRQIVSQLEALGRPPRRAVAEVQTTALGVEGDWTLHCGLTQAVVVGVAPTPFAFDLDGVSPPPLLLTAAQQARDANRLPARCVLHCAPGAPQFDIAAWQETLSIPVEEGAPYQWSAATGGTNLLHGEFMSDKERMAWLRRARPVLWVMAAAIAAELVLSAGQVLWQRGQLKEARDRMQTVFRTAFPNQPIVDPAAQMRSQLNQLKRAHGQLGDDDAIALLALVGEVLGGDARDALDGMKYENGRLELTLSPRVGAQISSITQRLNARGLTVAQQGDNRLAIRKEVSQ